MSNLIGNYAPDDFTIVITVAGKTHRITGFAAGTFVNMERLVPTSEPYQGVGDDAFGRVKRRVTAMNVGITLHQHSPSNTVLQQIQLADARTPGNEYVFSCTMKDTSGQTVASSNNAIIAGPPTVDFSDTTETRTWQIFMFGSDLFIGGNMLLDEPNVDIVESLGGVVEDRWKLSSR